MHDDDTDRRGLRLVSTTSDTLSTPSDIGRALKAAGWSDDEAGRVERAAENDGSEAGMMAARALVEVAQRIAS